MSKRFVCTVAAMSMAFSSLAFAQDDKDTRADRANAAERAGRIEPGRPGAGRQIGRDMRAPEERRADDRRDFDRRGRGAGPDHNFYRGGRLPAYYRGHEYVVDDWRAHRLSAPPRGYHWVQVGADYVLVAIATGIIASILLNQ